MTAGRKNRLRTGLMAAVLLFGMALGGVLGRGCRSAARGADAIPPELRELVARNPETRQFVADYPEEINAAHAIDLSAEAASDTVPLLLQWDERWGYETYNDTFFALSGCGPTCLSMAALYLTGDPDETPLYMAEFAQAHGYAVPGSGSSWTLISEGARELGFDVTEIPWDEQRILANLDVGNPIICVMGPGDFTTDGHFIVLTAEENGAVRVNDPNSRANSERLWALDTLREQTRVLWVLRYY